MKSLRTLALWVALIAILVVLSRIVSPPDSRVEAPNGPLSRDEIVSVITRYGGMVDFEDNNPAKRVVRVNLFNASDVDTLLEYVRQLEDLQELCVRRSDLTDAGLQHLEGLTQLESLEFSCTEITDAGLEYLKELEDFKRLEHIYLPGGENRHITREAVEALREALPNCRVSWPKDREE